VNPTFWAMRGHEVCGIAHSTLVDACVRSNGGKVWAVEDGCLWWPCSPRLSEFAYDVRFVEVKTDRQLRAGDSLANVSYNYGQARGWLRLAREGKGDLDECLHHARKSRQWAREARNKYLELTSAGS